MTGSHVSFLKRFGIGKDRDKSPRILEHPRHLEPEDIIRFGFAAQTEISNESFTVDRVETLDIGGDAAKLTYFMLSGVKHSVRLRVVDDDTAELALEVLPEVLFMAFKEDDLAEVLAPDSGEHHQITARKLAKIPPEVQPWVGRKYRQEACAKAYLHKGDLARALEYVELGVEKAPTPGDRMMARATLACALCRAGNPRECTEILTQEVIPKFQAGRFVSMEMFFKLFLGEGYWLVGEYDKATQTLEECLEIAERCGMKYFMGSAHRLLGEMGLTTGPTQPEESLAASHFEKSIAVLREIQAENELALAYAGYGRLHKQQGDVTPARAYLIQALEIFERLGTLGEPEKVQQT